MKKLIKALRVAFEVFRMVYRGWEVNRYEKFEDNGKYLEGTIWSGVSGWYISKDCCTFLQKYKTPFEAIPEVERLVAKRNNVKN